MMIPMLPQTALLELRLSDPLSRRAGSTLGGSGMFSSRSGTTLNVSGFHIDLTYFECFREWPNT